MRTLRKYIRHPDGQIVGCFDLIEWGNWFETADRHIARTEVREGVCVSTVFLGLDHNFTSNGAPILFETTVFGGELDGEQERYETEKQALGGHNRWVAVVKNSEGKTS